MFKGNEDVLIAIDCLDDDIHFFNYKENEMDTVTEPAAEPTTKAVNVPAEDALTNNKLARVRKSSKCGSKNNQLAQLQVDALKIKIEVNRLKADKKKIEKLN